jgi:dipeptidyl aminopeptidase/acylaminoacyl peptidase
VKEGIVDKGRMCLHGGSYGGYATLQGLVREPDLFRCGTPFVAVTDLGLWQTVQWSDTAMNRESDFFEKDFVKMVGDNKADAELFQRTSPARNADKIKAPVLLVMGEDDVRVPLIHGETMRDALKKAGKKVEYVTYTEEGHGFNKQENVVDFYTRIEKFLAKYLK